MITTAGKIDRCMNEFGLSLEDSKRIVTSEDNLLNIQELGMKYGNCNVGGYPTWLTPEAHLAICVKTVDDMFKPEMARYYSKNDLVNSLYLWSVIRLNQFTSFAHLKCGCVRAYKNMQRDTIKHFRIEGYEATDVNEFAMKNSEYKTFIQSHNCSAGFDIVNLVESIKSIDDKEVRDLMILCGYLIGEIEELKPLYENCIQGFSASVVQQLKQLLLESAKHDVANVGTTKKRWLTMEKIIKTLGIKRSGVKVKNEILRYCKRYQII